MSFATASPLAPLRRGGGDASGGLRHPVPTRGEADISRDRQRKGEA